METNKKEFKLVNRASKTFSIAINNFAFAVTFLFRIRDHIIITILPKFTTKMFSTIIIKKVRLIISSMKLRTSLTQTINSRYIKVTYFIREILKFTTTITFYHPFIFISKARQKLVSTIYQGILHLSITPTLAQFFLLGYFDPDTLGTWDASTLGNMDYTS